MTESRGLRNRNPGNVRHGEKWQGLTEDQPDPDFCTFKSPEYGIRAMCRILLTYKATGADTIREIVNRWAPPNENDTGAYVAAVNAMMACGPDDPVDVDQAEIMRPLLRAIIIHENGKCPYSQEVIDNGMRLAGISDTKPQPALASNGGKGITIATVSTGVAAATETVRQVQEVRTTVDGGLDAVQWLLTFGPGIAFIFVAAGIGIFAWDWWHKRQRLGV